MSAESCERQTINIPSTKNQPAPVPGYELDDRSTAALRDLEEGDLLQMVVDHEEGIIEFADLSRQVVPDSVGSFFEAPTTRKFAFYRHPGSGAVILIWTRFPAATSTKTTRVQNRIRRDLGWYADKEGIQTVYPLDVSSQKYVTNERMQEAINSPGESKDSWKVSSS